MGRRAKPLIDRLRCKIWLMSLAARLKRPSLNEFLEEVEISVRDWNRYRTFAESSRRSIDEDRVTALETDYPESSKPYWEGPGKIFLLDDAIDAVSYCTLFELGGGGIPHYDALPFDYDFGRLDGHTNALQAVGDGLQQMFEDFADQTDDQLDDEGDSIGGALKARQIEEALTRSIAMARYRGDFTYLSWIAPAAYALYSERYELTPTQFRYLAPELGPIGCIERLAEPERPSYVQFRLGRFRDNDDGVHDWTWRAKTRTEKRGR